LDCKGKKGVRDESGAAGTLIAKIFVTKVLRHKRYGYDFLNQSGEKNASICL
jgi:hypothetical protein